jgi:hypothetical protein
MLRIYTLFPLASLICFNALSMENHVSISQGQCQLFIFKETTAIVTALTWKEIPHHRIYKAQLSNEGFIEAIKSCNEKFGITIYWGPQVQEISFPISPVLLPKREGHILTDTSWFDIFEQIKNAHEQQ